MNRPVLILLCFVSLSLNAQFTFDLEQTIPVTDKNGTLLSEPWAGGLNAAQYNSIDLDQDGNVDLALFDRMANKVTTFLNINNTYVHHPEYEPFFPSGVQNFMLLRDFNCDGKQDIFTYDILGIKVFENTTEEGQNLSWKHFKFYTGTNSPKSDVVLTKGFSGMVNIKTQFDDLPAITDADGDGDLDLFAVRFVGNGQIEYHKNFSVERYGTCDSLVFERITQSWGNFQECGCAQFAFNGTDCPTGGRTKHAGGKSLLVFDANGDNNVDIVFSESECTQLYLLLNEGTIDAPVINGFSTFPPDAPVDFEIFPAAFYEDVNFDGVKDLISSPNIYHIEDDGTNLEASNWFYENTGTNDNPFFEFRQNNFLQAGMIDVGFNAVPAFADLEGDGDLDLFISGSAISGESSITLYENTGTPTEPEFEFVTNNYLNFEFEEFRNLKIHFSDLEGNQTTDLIFTASDELGFTKLYLLQNARSQGLDFDGQNFLQTQFVLSPSENVSLVDVSGDGLADLLVGRSNGDVEYWLNTSSNGEPAFTLENKTFIEASNNEIRSNLSVAAADFNVDGKDDLIVGDHSGILKLISDYKSEKTETGNLLKNALANEGVNQNLGGQLWPVTANIFGTASPAIVVGNVLGGISILRNEFGFGLFPNPIVKNGTITVHPDDALNLWIYSTTGSLIAGPVRLENGSDNHLKLPLASGFYIFRFTGKNKSFSRKIIVR